MTQPPLPIGPDLIAAWLIDCADTAEDACRADGDNEVYAEQHRKLREAATAIATLQDERADFKRQRDYWYEAAQISKAQLERVTEAVGRLPLYVKVKVLREIVKALAAPQGGTNADV